MAGGRYIKKQFHFSEGRGVRAVLRFTNHQVEKDLARCLSVVDKFLAGTIPSKAPRLVKVPHWKPKDDGGEEMRRRENLGVFDFLEDR